MDRIDRNVAEGQIFVEILVGADVSAAALEAHFDGKLAAFADGGQVHIAVEHFDIGIALDLAAADIAGVIHIQAHGFDAIARDLEGDLFQVENDVGGVFDHAGNGAELVFNTLDADGRN